MDNKTTDWVSFVQNLENITQLNVSLKILEELDQETEILITDVQQEMWKNTKSIKRKIAGNNYSNEMRNTV